MRQVHRTLAFFVSPFLVVSAVTGLLWAYAPHLYLKPSLDAKVVIDENGGYAPVADAIRAAKALAGGGRVGSVTLKGMAGKPVYVIPVESKGGSREVWVDARTAQAEPAPKDPSREFHAWVMKLHKLNFFGTKKELTAFPGLGLLAMLFTGLFLFKKGAK